MKSRSFLFLACGPLLAALALWGSSCGGLQSVPQPSPVAASQRAAVADGHGVTRAKMKGIIIPLIDFEDTSLEEAVDFLRQRSRELDPDRSMPGVGAIVVKKAGKPARPIKRLQMKNVSLWDALQRVAVETGMKVEITDQAIEVVAR